MLDVIAAEAPAQPITIDPDYWNAHGRKFIKAVIMQAVYDARDGDLSARDWLISNDGQLWIDLLDIHPDKIKQWTERDYKPEKRKKRGAWWKAYAKPPKSRQEAPHAILTA